MDYLNNIVSKFSIINLSYLSANISKPEFLFGGIVLVFLLLYGISLGRTRALLSLLGIYIAFVFNETFVFFNQLFSWIPVKNVNLVRVCVFLVMYGAIFFVLNRSLVKTRLSLKEASFISVFIISMLQMGLLLSVVSNQLGPEIISNLPGIFFTLFGTKTALFYWAILPIVSLLFLRKRG